MECWCSFFCFTLMCVLFRGLELCNPVSRMSEKDLSLRTALAAAERSITNGRIILNMELPMQEVRLKTRGLPMCSGSAPLLTLTRAKLDETAVFACPLDHCASHNTSCEDLDQLVWLHRNYSVWHVRCEGYPSPFSYSQTRSANTAYLLIHNITSTTTGSVRCLCQLHNDTHQFCVNHVYEFRPQLGPADVFTTPVLNVSHPAGKNITLLSELRIRLADRFYERYIFRYNGTIVAAPVSHPLTALTLPEFPYAGLLRFYATNLTITFESLPKSASGQYEIWVRPYMELDEWIIQTINLKII